MMGESHDTAATMYGDYILSRIRSDDSEFKQVFSTSLIRIGDWDWPRPDYVCFDEERNSTYALEFKPPFQTKREYLTGLGQSIAYLQKHSYSGLILPKWADDGFLIADFITDSLLSSELKSIPISLYAYDFNDNSIQLLKPITNTRTIKNIPKSNEEVKTFWCWWRDLSNYELYDLLNLSFMYSDHPGDIYTDYVYPTFYKKMINRLTKQWDGKPRSKNGTVASMKAEKQNYKIPLVQLELWTSSEGRLTDLGFKLLEIGKKYGPGSKKFCDYIAYLVLVNGKHLDLINIIDRYQKASGPNIASSSKDYVVELERFLSDNGCIGKRKPTAIKTGAKNSYLRDEMKLWNKLGLLYLKNKKDYYFPGEGYKFNWNEITRILITNN